METINKHNYEAYFLDYYEKNLSAEEVAELMLFLENNPHLKDEFEEYEEIVIEPENNITFDNKSSLKKEIFITVGNINSENYEDYIIADLEKQITLQEKSELKSFIKQNPNAEIDFNIYRKTFLKPDLSIVYPYKEQLRKPLAKTIRPFTRRLYYATAIAASAALLVGLFLANNKSSSTESYAFASRNNSVYSPEREIYQAEKNEFPISRKSPKINKIQNAPKREIIVIDKIDPISNIYLASNMDYFIPELKSLNNINNSTEHINLYQQNNDNDLASKEDKADFNDLRNYVSAGINKIIKPDSEMPDTLRKLNGWDIADIGISGINRISKQNFDLKKEKAADGTIQSFTFSANNFEFSRQLKKKNK